RPATPTAISTLSLHDALPISLTPPVDVTAALVYLGSDPTFRIPTGVADTTGGVNGGVRFVNGFAIRSYDISFNKFTGTAGVTWQDRKSTRLNSSHVEISYAVF